MKISVCLAIRNGEKYIDYLNKLFADIETQYKEYSFEYFIYENNSTDNTKTSITTFAENRNCKYLLEDLPNNSMRTGITKERGNHMANVRNKLKDFHSELHSDYTLLLDCDVKWASQIHVEPEFILNDSGVDMAVKFPTFV